MSKEKEEFTTEVYEDITFSVAENRKIVHIYDELGLVEMRLSSAAMYMLCKSIVDLLEKEGEAYDLRDRAVLIPIGELQHQTATAQMSLSNEKAPRRLDLIAIQVDRLETKLINQQRKLKYIENELRHQKISLIYNYATKFYFSSGNHLILSNLIFLSS